MQSIMKVIEIDRNTTRVREKKVICSKAISNDIRQGKNLVSGGRKQIIIPYDIQ